MNTEPTGSRIFAYSRIDIIPVLAGAWILKEPINIRHAVGACLITAGVACVGATGL